MNRRRLIQARDERGASLVLAIVFTVVIGAIIGGTLALVNTGLNNRRSLDAIRDREYAADAAVESAIARVGNLAAPGPALIGCGATTHYNQTVNGTNIRVNCTNVPSLTFQRVLQRNVVFQGCIENGSDCADNNTIVRAQVNYETVGAGAAIRATRTWVQSWSVNA